MIGPAPLTTTFATVILDTTVGNMAMDTIPVDPGFYTIEEVNIPTGFDLTNIECGSGDTASICKGLTSLSVEYTGAGDLTSIQAFDKKGNQFDVVYDIPNNIVTATNGGEKMHPSVIFYLGDNLTGDKLADIHTSCSSAINIGDTESSKDGSLYVDIIVAGYDLILDSNVDSIGEVEVPFGELVQCTFTDETPGPALIELTKETNEQTLEIFEVKISSSDG